MSARTSPADSPRPRSWPRQGPALSPCRSFSPRTPVDAPAQEIRPQEFAERRRVLGEAALPAQFASNAAVRVVGEVGHALGQRVLVAPPAVLVERMHPAAIVEHGKEGVLVELRQVAGHLDTFLEQGTSHVMMVDDIV